MKGLILCVAVVLGIVASNLVIAQETSPAPVVIDGSVIDATSECSGGSCAVQPTLIGMSRHAVKHTVERGRCVAQQTVSRGQQFAKTVWNKRPHLRRCKCS